MALALIFLFIVLFSLAFSAIRKPKNVAAPNEESERARQIGNAVGLSGGDITDAVIVDHALRNKGRSRTGSGSDPAVEAATAAAIAAAVLGD